MRPMLTNTHLMALAERPGPWATICMPLAGGGPLAKHDPVRYRNLVRSIADQLAARATEDARKNVMLAALRSVENVRDVFNAGARGLVVFASADGVEEWHLPVAIEECAVLDERPFLEPLIPIVTDPTHFYVIAMSMHDVRLVECNRFVARELPLPKEMPRRVEEAAGWDVEEPYKAVHSSGRGGAVHHTHAGGKDDLVVDLEKFVRDVDEGLWPSVVHKGSPIVLMTSEKLDQVFRRMTRLKSVVAPTIFGSWDRTSIDELHTRALEVIEPRLEERIEQAKERFSNLWGTGAATSQVEQVVIAAADGRVDTLFVREGAHLEGHYDIDTHSVHVGNGRADTTDLLDRATTDTFLTGGQIYRLPSERMPVDGDVAAILRY